MSPELFWAIGNNGCWLDIKYIADQEVREILTEL